MNRNIFTGIFVSIFAAGSCIPFLFTSATSSDLHTRVTVTHVTDGDTFDVWIDEKKETIRILGIDTPELKKGRKRSCYGKEASTLVSRILSGQEVLLLKDKLAKDRDKYGRLLRTVKVRGKYDISVLLLVTGHASVYEYENFQKKPFYKKLEKYAQSRNFGIWSEKCTQ